MPRGRFPFGRWRWAVSEGDWLLAAGWTTHPHGAQRALCRAASRRLHELRGVAPLRPEDATLLDPLRPTRASRVETPIGTCLLVPQALEAGQAAAA